MGLLIWGSVARWAGRRMRRARFVSLRVNVIRLLAQEIRMTALAGWLGLRPLLRMVRTWRGWMMMLFRALVRLVLLRSLNLLSLLMVTRHLRLFSWELVLCIMR